MYRVTGFWQTGLPAASPIAVYSSSNETEDQSKKGQKSELPALSSRRMRYLLIFHTVIDIWLLSHAVCTLNLPAHDIPKIIGFKIFYILEIKGDKVK